MSLPPQPQQQWQPPQIPTNYSGTPQPPQHVAPPTKPKKPKRFGWVAASGFAVGGLVLGSLIGGAGSAEPGTLSEPAPPASVQTTSAPTSAEPTAEPAGFVARKADWKVAVKVKSRQCFGSAGCNVTIKVNPDYVGSQRLPDEGVIEVTYKLKGVEDPLEDSFTVEDGDASFTEEHSTGTKTASSKITAVVTEVTYDPEG